MINLLIDVATLLIEPLVWLMVHPRVVGTWVILILAILAIRSVVGSRRQRDEKHTE